MDKPGGWLPYDFKMPSRVDSQDRLFPLSSIGMPLRKLDMDPLTYQTSW